MDSYSVRLSSDDLVFSAAHFITLGPGQCERLHGHNYRVVVEVHGPLGENQYVVDFVAMHEVVRAMLGEWDHRVLLPSQHPEIRVTGDDRELTVRWNERRWVFPRDDCVLLPVSNTTAELLAQHLLNRLLTHLRTRWGLSASKLRVELHESFGHSAACVANHGNAPVEGSQGR